MKAYVVITGATSGIGKALACLFIEKNYSLIAIGRNVNELSELESKGQKGQVISVSANLSDEVEIEKILSILQKEDKILYLIHCAATAEPLKPLLDSFNQDIKQSLAVNILAPLLLTKGLSSHFDGRYTRILLMDSDYVIGAPNAKIRPNITGCYAVSKSALSAIRAYFQAEIKTAQTTSLNPGPVKTNMYDRIIKETATLYGLFQPALPTSPETVASFIYNVLTTTSDERYVTQNWDYRKASNDTFKVTLQREVNAKL